MKTGFRQSMASLHTWMGLLLGWVLYFMFVTGTLGYLDTEIDRWMQPEAPVAVLSGAIGTVADSVRAENTWIEQGMAHLEAHAPGANRWLISLPVDRNNPHPDVFWNGAKGEGISARGSIMLDPGSGLPVTVRDTSGGQLLYRMHWQLHYLPRALSDWLIGVATLFMLVAIVTGVITHKKIFIDFFTLRFGKGQRSWLDSHNIVSVVSLPFQLMITYSGLIFMMFTYLPLMIAVGYGNEENSRRQMIDEIFGTQAVLAAAEVPAPLVPLDRVLATARQQWGSAPIRSVDIRHPYDAHARILVQGKASSGPLRTADRLIFDGVTGELLEAQKPADFGGKWFRDLMIGMHEGLFAGPLLRVLYLFSGLLGALMIATGLILWTAKRRQRAEKARDARHLGLRLVEKLNVATVAGLWVAIAAYFWANRVLPVEFSARAAWEAHAMFIVWGLMFVHACCRPLARAWVEQWWLAAAAAVFLPLLNALTTDRHLGVSLAQGDWVMAGFDLSALALGLAFAGLAWYLPRRKTAPARAGQRRVSFAPGVAK